MDGPTCKHFARFELHIETCKECQKSLRSLFGRLGGRVKSPAKAAAARKAIRIRWSRAKKK